MWAGVLDQFDNIFHGLVAVDVYTLSLGNGRKLMKWHVRRQGCSLGMCMEHAAGILAQFDDIFHGLVADDVYTLFPLPITFSRKWQKWMKWHVRRPGSSLGMWIEHV